MAAPRRLWVRRLAWFVGLWVVSVAAVAGAAYGFRALIGA